MVTFCDWLLSLTVMFLRFVHVVASISASFLFFKDFLNLFIYLFIYLFILERGEGKEKERERNINVWVPLMRPQLGT